MVRLTLDRGERCVLNSRCEDGKGRAREHMNLSLTCFRTPLSFFFSFFSFLVFGLTHAEAVYCVVEETLDMFSRELRKNQEDHTLLPGFMLRAGARSSLERRT